MIDVIKQQFAEAMPRHVRLNKTREFMQALCLKLMSEKGLFDRMAFLGGTALRMIFQLRRFSEDLDFSLLKAGDIEVADLSESLAKGLRLYGFQVETKAKAVGAVRSILFRFPGLERSERRETRHQVGCGHEPSSRRNCRKRHDAKLFHFQDRAL